MREKREPDYNSAVNICDNIWWVGHYLEGDPFQCHAYLIEMGENSVLVDPGSKLTFSHTLEKIEQVMPFSRIRYFIAHHQDPDITGALEIIDTMVERKDAVVLSHWRANTLLKHMDLKMPLRCVEELGWSLETGGLDLKFIFTPYLHFPGAFCTYDRKTGSLFSSDIFGGFTEGFSLYATGESYVESMRLFHEHYMPSREILVHSLENLAKFDLKRILPQHGSIIEEKLIPFIMDQMKGFDCGLYLMAQNDSDFHKLSKLNRFLNDFLETLILHRDFETTVRQLLEHIKLIIPATGISFLIPGKEENCLLLEATSRYRSKQLRAASPLADTCRSIKDENIREVRVVEDRIPRIVIPLKEAESDSIFAFSLVSLSGAAILDKETTLILKQLSTPLCMAVEREMIQQQLDREKQRFYELSIKDNLTGFYNRTYMNETLPRIFSHQDRGIIDCVAVILFDLDHFKSVNDTFGHSTGDEVLKATARTIGKSLREGDIAVRIGGEEFALFLILDEKKAAYSVAERIRSDIETIDFTGLMGDRKQTISAGLAFRKKGETLESLSDRADCCLYEAKNSGRNRVVADESI